MLGPEPAPARTRPQRERRGTDLARRFLETHRSAPTEVPMNYRTLSTLIALSTLAASAGAQDAFVLTIDQPASAWTWTGVTGIGAITGVPDQNFNLNGTVDMSIAGSASLQIASARFLSAEQHVVPNPLQGFVPNPIPGFPHLADIEIQDLVISIASPAFNVAANGNFSTVLTTTVTQGLLIVHPLGGAQTQTDLAGTVGPTNNVSGNLDMSSSRIELDSPQSASFPFTDATSGISGNFTIDGVLAADFQCNNASHYCSASVNSTGSGALMGIQGTTQVWRNDLVLTAGPVPQQPGLFYYGPQSANQTFGNGKRCVGGQTIRLPVIVPQAGSFHYSVDYSTLPAAGAILPGATRYFQAWFRDPLAGGSAFNLSDGLRIQFCP